MEVADSTTGKCRWMRLDLKCCKLGRFKFGFSLRLNPVVSFISAAVIWGFVVWCMVKAEKANATMMGWKLWITETFTWMYIGTQDMWTLFIVVLYFSKYSKMKLGKPNDKPEFNDASYFTMLFAAGVGIGLFYFGVAEPIYHYEPGHYGNRYYDRYTDNQRAQDAMNLTLFHWGIHAWIVYAIVGLVLAFVGYRMDLPMTIRSCLYPLLGDNIYGWMGDMVDIFSVVCTMFGVCTSLGVGVTQINTGIKRIFNDIEYSVTNQIIIIWCVTALATMSVISGLKVGIRRLSEICFVLGLFIMMIGLLADDTWYLLSVFVQSVGYYIQWIIQLGFHTDAFAQLGNAPDKKEAPLWMNDWTIFYWGWWIAWSPFVGMFIAKISKGRTIKEFINATLTAPILYSFLWFSIFGGAGLRMERNAALANISCESTIGGANATKSLNGLFRLSCREKNDMWFDVVGQYGDLGFSLSIVSLVSIALYFVTSSDSGSLVIDCLSANGDPEPPVVQRIFWALTEGACATALLYAGGKEALNALQTVSIGSGVPYTILVSFMCVAMWRAVKMEAGDIDPQGPKFKIGLLDVFSSPTIKSVLMIILAIIAPWYTMGFAAYKTGGGTTGRCTHTIVLTFLFYIWIILMMLEPVVAGISYVGWTILMGFFAYGTGIRYTLREKFGINGNIAEDFFAVMLLYPFAAYQMHEQAKQVKDISESKSEPPPYHMCPETYI